MSMNDNVSTPPEDEQVFDMSLVGYARVSTEDQNLALQVHALQRDGVHPDNIHVEKRSGVSTRRPFRDLAVKQCREGMTFVVWRLDRVGRSLQDLLKFMQHLEDNQIGFRSLTENVDTTTPSGRVMLAVAGAFAQFERDIIAERTKAGVKVAMERGVKFGQPTKLTPEVKELFEARVAAGESVDTIAKSMKIAPATFRRIYTRPVLDAIRNRIKR